MDERKARYVASGLAAVSALLVPIASFVNMAPLTPTAFAGATLVMVYAAANARLLVATQGEWKQAARQGTVVPIAFVLGALLIIAGLVEAYVRGRATHNNGC